MNTNEEPVRTESKPPFSLSGMERVEMAEIFNRRASKLSALSLKDHYSEEEMLAVRREIERLEGFEKRLLE